MPAAVLKVEGFHHSSLGQAHFSSNWSQVALLVPVLRLVMGGNASAAGFDPLPNAKHEPGNKSRPCSYQRQVLGTAGKVTRSPYDCIMFASRDGLSPSVSAHLGQSHGRPPGGVPLARQEPRDTSCLGCSVGWLVLLPTPLLTG